MASSPNTKVATVASGHHVMFTVAGIPVGTATLVVPASDSDRTLGIYIQNESGADVFLRQIASTGTQVTLNPIGQEGSSVVIPGSGALYATAQTGTVTVSGYYI